MDVTDGKIVLVVDVDLRRPACVLLQAGLGGDSHRVSQLFHSDTWLLSPTPGMRRVAGTPEQWQRFAKEIERGAR